MNKSGWVIAALLAAGTTWAGDDVGQSSGVVKASDLMGMKVRDHQDEEIGEIKDLALNLESKEVKYVVLSTGGRLGGMMGRGKLIGVPADELQPAPSGEGYVAGISKEAIEAAEGLGDEGWPEEPTLTADTQPPSESEQFAQLDADGDGYVSESEAQSREKLAENFDEADQNADQQIDQTEFAAFEQKQQ